MDTLATDQTEETQDLVSVKDFDFEVRSEPFFSKMSLDPFLTLNTEPGDPTETGESRGCT